MKLVEDLVLLTCLSSTLFMVGVVLFVQVVHYPLFRRVGVLDFPRYHADNGRLTSFVVALPMIVELLTSVYLAVRPPHGVVGEDLAYAGLAAAIASWGLTGWVSVPLHNRLAEKFDTKAHQSLVRSNLFRLLTWMTHAAILLVMTARAMH